MAAIKRKHGTPVVPEDSPLAHGDGVQAVLDDNGKIHGITLATCIGFQSGLCTTLIEWVVGIAMNTMNGDLSLYEGSKESE
jgi:hypothetical protein